ncbi:uncharacterized protein LOC118405422 [Branchiostoma floridae]|uniref:Uncharacterized protein LOC118405422 n=1 Tax=Branchiostoma floridae TaxID=7739 RepID=A0A9J7KFR5_BRAFL|nr:uncharacterized protein LOC118405422 [Branchiostoma floridae]
MASKEDELTEDNTGVKRQPKKAEWLLDEESRRKKAYRSSMLGRLTSKSNSIRESMTDPNNKRYVQDMLAEWKEIFRAFKEANKEYQLTLSLEQKEEDDRQWLAGKLTEADLFHHEVERWIDAAQPQQAVGTSLILDDTVKPSDSVSQAGSDGRRSNLSHTSTTSRVNSEVRKIELMAKAAALKERLALERRSLEIEQEKRMLELTTEISVEDAKIKFFQELEEQEQEREERRLPALNPDVPSFVPRTRVKQEDPHGTKSLTMGPPQHGYSFPTSDIHVGTQGKGPHHSNRKKDEEEEITPEKFLQGLVQQQAEVTKLMVEHNNQASLPTRAIVPFEGDPLNYAQFMKAFRHAIEEKTTDAEDKLHYLGQYTRGDARELVTSCALMEPEDGLMEAKKLLKERYGTPFKVSRAYAEEARKWSEIKHDDKSALRKFSLFLTKCLNAMKGDEYLQELDHYTNIALLVGKLPYRLKERWRRKSHDIQRQGRVKFKDLVDFVKQEEQISSNDMFDDKSAKEPFKRRDRAKGSSLAVTTGQEELKCSFCEKRNHDVTECRVLANKSYDERLQYIKGQGLCFGCLKKTHLARDCKQRATCGKCQKSHPTVLHREVEAQPKKTAAVGRIARSDWEGVPSIIPVKVRSKTTNVTIQTYAFLDNGSDVVFCTESLKKRLKTSGRKVKLTLNTINGSKEANTEVLEDLEVSDLGRENIIPIATAYTQEKIPASKKNIISTEDLKDYPYLREVELPEIDAEIGLLIGNNVPKAVEPWQVINSQGDGPYAVRTLLGWSVNGPLKGASDDKNVNRISVDQNLETQLESYFNHDFSEAKEDKREMSMEDKRFMEIVEEETKKSGDHYEVPLPFKRPNPAMPNNRPLAVQRLKHLQRKLSKDVNFKKDYADFMENIIEKGYAEKIPPDENVGPQHENENATVWYVPHHGVYHPQKKKIRVVFDCAAEYAGTSLNQQLLQGPDLNNTLVGVLTRFRQEPVGLMADVESMFSQVKVPEKYRDYQRFLWWPRGNLDEPPEEYRMTVHVFGATSSPSCAGFALKKLADDGEGQYAKGVLDAIRNNFYVDDLLKATSTVKEGGDLAKGMREACKDGGFRLTKWVSNQPEVIDSVPPTERANEVRMDLDHSHTAVTTERALGMLWHVQSDTLGFRAVRREKPATRRGILSVVSSFYDPLGLVAPALLPPKKILQDLCKAKLDWDEEIPDKDLKVWRQWEAELPLLSSSFMLSRCVKPVDFGITTSVQLHHFSDASEQGYGTASYLRMTNQQGRVHCALLMGKARVAPLKAITIPRLELNAAVVAVRVNQMIQRELDIKIDKTFFWTDSTTVLRYINNEQTRYHTFVANRLTTIRNASDTKQWRYVESKRNPADDASRGQDIQKFVENDRWVKGPSFLWCPESEWPQMPNGLEQPPQRDPEVKVNAIELEQAEPQSPMDALIAHYSSWHRLKKAVAWILKVKEALKQKSSKQRSKTTVNERLSTRDLKTAEAEIVTHVQRKHYSEEIAALQSQGFVKTTSSVYRLDPMVDEEGILRVRGRLSHSSLAQEAKHPVILPKESEVAKLILRSIHEEHGHMGRNYVISKSRERYWIPQVNALVRRLNKKCVTCRRLRGKTGKQQMADLPSSRLTPDEPPFTRVGVDYFGPIETKRGRSIVKRYGVVFTCMSSRAVHIEKADSLDTDSCINALRRFVSRRGQVKEMWSDNGTNLVGAKAELQRELKMWNQEKIKDTLLQKEIDWKFSPPTGSHFGGVWERQIRTIRQVLNAIVKKHTLDDEGLHTLLCEAESIVNGRPLTTTSNEVNDLEALTPNHLLNMKMQTTLPPNLTDKNDLYARRRWKQVQYLASLFWRRWSKEYMASLQERSKWGTRQRDLAVGDIVLLKDEQSPRGVWPLGRIVQVMPGSRGLVRRVKVKTQHSVLERPIDKLCPLLEEDQSTT